LLKPDVCSGLFGGAFGDSTVGQWLQTNFSDIFGLWYNILFAVLIIVLPISTLQLQYRPIRCPMILKEVVVLFLVFALEMKPQSILIQ
jgi:hypothetical protein